MASCCRSTFGIIVWLRRKSSKQKFFEEFFFLSVFHLTNDIPSLGSDDQTILSVGSLLDDDVWHDISISHEDKDISLSVDRITVHKNASGDFSKLNLDKFVSID